MGPVLWFLLGVIAWLLYRCGTRRHSYWAHRGVAGPRCVPFLGTHADILLSRTSFTDFFRRLYRAYPGERYIGVYSANQPTLLVRDPDLIRHILTKDFEYFPDRARPRDAKANPFSDNLFNLDGIRWKSMRIKLSPTFSSGKIKNMFPLLQECAEELRRVLDAQASIREAIEVKDVLCRFTTDVIGSCAFGINCNSLKNPGTDFHRYGLRIFDSSLRNRLRLGLLALFPNLGIVHRLLQDTETSSFFTRIVDESVSYREEKKVKRNDFLDLLIEIKNRGKLVDDSVDLVEDPFLKVQLSTSSDEFKFDDKTLAAQVFLFFAAGFETSSTTMSFCLLELSHRQDIQEKLRQDVDAAFKAHGAFTYEALADMSYMDKVIAETLRKYSPAAVLVRSLIKPYKVPDSDLVLEAGTRINIPVAALHHDPQYFPDPENFDPERFSAASKAARHLYTYLPFGEGPRICIGMRFGLLQTKLGLATIVRNFLIAPSSLSKYPIHYKKGTFVASTDDGCHVTIQRRPSH